MKQSQRIISLICLFICCCLLVWAFPPADDDYLHAVGNKLVDKDGHEVWLTGINWYGFETHINVAQGLTDRNYKDILNTAAELGFNVLRLPISTDLVYKWSQGSDVTPTDVNKAVNPEFEGKQSLFIFDAIMAQCKVIGLKVILDIHNVMPGANEHTVWYDGTHPVSHWITAWEFLATRFKNDDTVIAMDLKNEPHGNPIKNNPYAKWDGSSDMNNFKAACEQVSRAIHAINPQVLVLVEGIETYPKPGFTWETAGEYDLDHCWWGGNLRGVADYPVNLGTSQNKLVYSPHDYGPSVYPQPWFTPGFSKETLLRDVWRPNWFFIYENNTAPLLIGEWGGPAEGDTLTWMTALRDFIRENKLHHTFWCLNRSSIGTEGIFTGGNWEGIDMTKVEFLKPSLWRDTSGRYVGLDHQVVLASHKSDALSTHTNVTLYYGGTLQTPTPTPPPTPIPLSPYYNQMQVLYKCGDTNPTSTQMKPQINIINTGNQTVALNELTVRYYYSKTGNILDAFNIDYAAKIGISAISCQTGNGYFSINFAAGAGSLAASGGESGEIQLRVNQTNGAAYNQADDYSFNASMLSYAPWDHILLLMNGQLVWGVEPGYPTASPTRTPTPTPTASRTPTPTPGGLTGDVNSDMRVDIIDAMLIAQYSAGMQPAVFHPAVADVNGSGTIDVVDALMIARYAAGLLPGL